MKVRKILLEWVIPFLLCLFMAACMTSPARAILTEVYKVSLSKREALATQNYVSDGGW